MARYNTTGLVIDAVGHSARKESYSRSYTLLAAGLQQSVVLHQQLDVLEKNMSSRTRPPPPRVYGDGFKTKLRPHHSSVVD